MCLCPYRPASVLTLPSPDSEEPVDGIANPLVARANPSAARQLVKKLRRARRFAAENIEVRVNPCRHPPRTSGVRRPRGFSGGGRSPSGSRSRSRGNAPTHRMTRKRSTSVADRCQHHTRLRRTMRREDQQLTLKLASSLNPRHPAAKLQRASWQRAERIETD